MLGDAPVTMRALRRRTRPALALAALMLVASCGGDDSSGSSISSPEQPVATSAPATTQTSTASTEGEAPSSSQQSGTQGGYSITGESFAPASDAKRGGTLTYLKFNEVDTLDPLQMRNAPTDDGPYGLAIFDYLFYFDEQGNVVPQIAESLTSDDAITWTLKIRDGVMFSDGTPYDAAAVEYNFLRFQDPANAYVNATTAQLLSKIEVVDRLTLRITTEEPTPSLPSALVFLSLIGSPTAIERLGDDFGSNPVGAGPFVLKSWTRGSEMVLERNPNYWNAPLPYLDEIVLKPVGDESQRSDTLCSGGGDFMYTAVAQTAELAPEDCGELLRQPKAGGVGLLLSVTKPPFDDPLAREALAYAIDAKKLNEVVFLNDVVPSGVFGEDSIFRGDATQVSYDRDRAQELLDEYESKHGAPLSFTLDAYTVLYFPAVAQFIQANLAEYGVEVSINSLDPNAGLERRSTGAFQAFIHSMAVGEDPDPELPSRFSCDEKGYAGYCNEAFDQAWADSRAAPDFATRVDYIDRAMEIFYDDHIWHILAPRVGYHLLTPGVHVVFTDKWAPMWDRAWKE